MKSRLRELIPAQQAIVQDLRKNHGDKKLGEYTVAQVGGGRTPAPLLLLTSLAGIRWYAWNHRPRV